MTSRGSDSFNRPAAQEIERRYLLKSMPPLPPGAMVLHIRQAYPPGPAPGFPSDPSNRAEGRVRQMSHQDGRVEFTATVKKGRGLVREEIERPISAEQFNAAWEKAADRRFAKTRYRVPVGDLTWEIDEYEPIDLALAEIELPRADHPVEIPVWLRDFIDREVTDEPQYTGYRIAEMIARTQKRELR